MMTEEQKQKIIEFLQKFGKKNNITMILMTSLRNKGELSDLLDRYSQRFDGPALARCFEWFQENEPGMEEELYNTIQHDLHGLWEDDDSGFSPRSESY